MEKNKENTYSVPAEDIQDKITLLMGLPPEEAAARLDKKAAPRRITASEYQSAESAPASNIAQDTLTPDPVIEPEKAPLEMVDMDVESEKDAAAVDEIIAEEEHPKTEAEQDDKEFFELSVKKPKGIKKIWHWWWGNATIRNLTIAIVVVGLIALFAVPSSRYFVLNTVGVRASMQFTVVDKVSGKPIKNVDITVQDVATKTDDQGVATINNLQLGPSDIQLNKRSFEPQTIPVVIGWGSNPFVDPMELTPTGTTFAFTITDYLSGEPVKNAEVTDGESIAISDDNGVANLTIEPTDDDIALTISGNQYRPEQVTIPATGTVATDISMVPAQKDVFISKRNGGYDIYGRYIDGKDEVLLLKATGSEQSDTHVAPRPTGTLVAAVSAREGIRNKEGYILSDVYIIDAVSGELVKVDGTQSERVRLIGWIDDSIVFVKTISGPSASFNTRQKIVAYNTKNKESKELASTDYFTDVKVVDKKIYYVIAASDGSQSKGLTVINVDGSDKKVVLAKTIWVVYRTGVDTFSVSADGNEWYAYTLSSGEVTKLEGAPADPQNITLVPSLDNKQVAWIETRDGKQLVLAQQRQDAAAKPIEIVKQSGVMYPLRWLSDSVILYTVNTPQESASYAVSVLGGSAQKVGDVTISAYDNSVYYY